MLVRVGDVVRYGEDAVQLDLLAVRAHDVQLPLLRPGKELTELVGKGKDEAILSGSISLIISINLAFSINLAL